MNTDIELNITGAATRYSASMDLFKSWITYFPVNCCPGV